jgi:hypothetical protein
MLNGLLENITEKDLQELVENNVLEKRTLEYKSALPGGSDGDHREFLADASSFANTNGGDIIFGITEVDGFLKTEIGIDIPNPDTEISRLENMMRDGINPRISTDFKVIDLASQKKFLILRVKPSLEAPHRVTYRGHDRFYRRNSNGKYAMDVAELRTAFLQSSDIVEKIKRFRETRISDIEFGNTPNPLMNNDAFIAIHILPLSTFNTSAKIDSNTLAAIRMNQDFRPFYPSGWSHQINLEGIVAYTTYNDPVTRTYTQLYRSGIIEAVESRVLADYRGTQNKLLPTVFIEKNVMLYSEAMINFLSGLDFKPPFYVFLTLVGIKGLHIQMPDNYINLEKMPIPINRLLLPEVIIESTTDSTTKKFRPIFDMIWNAGGHSQSLNFDANDNFIAQ